ncbi:MULTISPECIES: hypothetical protein [Legionella]|uniref:Glycine-rich protein n=1 Tax=Legionella resiliens TaxID=2905958 RepID=A0ABS8XA64_9GAMM|nr:MULTISPECIES: hypothetical protein [unclassified Legionella]MCE0724634.1 hypothetical protein [Legionella sp. 9fVS26]MCE3533788.1 hypothetical protein [Legionella sp. 8cVS16]QLZ69987.1 hypothetical protein FOLKNPGA_02787 [Legionella sp. PC1000]
MSRNSMSSMMRAVVFALGLFTAGASFAHGGWHGGYYHGGGWHGGYYHGGGWRGGYYGGWGGGWVGPGVVIGVPYYNDYYYPECQSVRVCNQYGHCWYQDSCY